MLNPELWKVGEFFNEIKNKIKSGEISLDRPFKTVEERQEFINNLVDIVSDEEKFMHFSKLLLNLKITDKDKTYDKFNALLRGLTPSELATITFLDIPMAMKSYYERKYTHSFLNWGEPQIGKSHIFKYMFQGFDVALIDYVYNLKHNNPERAMDALRGWAQEKADYIKRALGIEIDLDKYVSALAEGIRGWAKAMPYSSAERYIKKLSEIIDNNPYDDINNIGVYQAVDIERSAIGEQRVYRIVPDRPITIMDNALVYITDEVVYMNVVYSLSDNKLPTFLLVQNNTINGLNMFEKTYIEDTHSRGRLGLNFFLYADPHHKLNPNIDTTRNEKIGIQLAKEKVDALLVDLVLGNALGDTIAEGILEEMKSSVHRYFRKGVEKAINNLNKGLAIAVATNFEPVFKKQSKDFNPYEVNSLEELINRFGNTGRWAIETFRKSMSDLVSDSNFLIKAYEKYLDKNEEEKPTIVADILYSIIGDDKIYDNYISNPLEELKKYSFRYGLFIRDTFSDENNALYNIEEGTIDEIKQKKLEVFTKNGFISKRVEERILNRPELKEEQSVMNEIDKEQREIEKAFMDDKQLAETYEKYKAEMTKDMTLNVAELVIEGLDRKYLVRNDVEEMRSIVNEITANQNVDNTQRLILYSKIPEINEKAFCMAGITKLEGKELESLRFNRTYRGFGMIPEVLTALKVFTKNKNDFKKLATLFTFGLFGVSPISLHILKSLGITRSVKLFTPEEVKNLIFEKFSKEYDFDKEEDLDRFLDDLLEVSRMYHKLHDIGAYKDFRDFIGYIVGDVIHNAIKNISMHKDTNVDINRELKAIGNLLTPFMKEDLRDKLLERLENKISNLDTTELLEFNSVFNTLEIIGKDLAEQGVSSLLDNKTLNDIKKEICKGKAEGGNNYINNFVSEVAGMVKKVEESGKLGDIIASYLIMNTLNAIRGL